MLTKDHRFRIGRTGPHLSPPTSGLIGKIVTFVASAAVLVVAFMFSLVILATVATIALLAGTYLGWKTRALRRQMRERPTGGHVIDGEVIREGDSYDKIPR